MGFAVFEDEEVGADVGCHGSGFEQSKGDGQGERQRWKFSLEIERRDLASRRLLAISCRSLTSPKARRWSRSNRNPKLHRHYKQFRPTSHQAFFPCLATFS